MLSSTDFTRVDEALAEVVGQQQRDLLHLHTLREQYNKLRGALGELPTRTSHAVTVPFGKRAFIPGRMVHTNEVMVLLGANYFAERSASQAAEIAGRRIEFFDKEIASLRKRLQSSKMKCEVARTMTGSHDNGAIEIREHVGQDGASTGEVVHQPIDPRRSGLQMEEPAPAPDPEKEFASYRHLDMEALVRRLEEEERAMSDGADSDDDEDEDEHDGDSRHDYNKLDSKRTENDPSNMRDTPGDERVVNHDSGRAGSTKTEVSWSTSAAQDALKASTSQSPRSPRDIYKMHDQIHSNQREKQKIPTASRTTIGAFNGVVMERAIPDAATGPTVQEGVSASAGQKPLSKFKQARLAARGGAP